MSLYESTFIIRHDMSTQQVEQLTENFTAIIKDNGGEVTKTEHWGLRTLAYRIKKNRKGHYVYLNVDAPSAAMQELERNLRLSEDVLRYLTVRVDELDDEPSPMMQARASRDERSRRGGRFRDDAPAGSGGAGSDAAKPAEAKTETAKQAEPADDAKPADDKKPADDEKPADAKKPADDEKPAESETEPPKDAKSDESGEQT